MSELNGGTYVDNADVLISGLKYRSKQKNETIRNPYVTDGSLLSNKYYTVENNEFQNIMRQISVSMVDTLEDIIRKSALNTTKKYLIYWTEVDGSSHKIYSHFRVYDSDEKMHDGYLVDLDEVRKYLKNNEATK